MRTCVKLAVERLVGHLSCYLRMLKVWIKILRIDTLRKPLRYPFLKPVLEKRFEGVSHVEDSDIVLSKRHNFKPGKV